MFKRFFINEMKYIAIARRAVSLINFIRELKGLPLLEARAANADIEKPARGLAVPHLRSMQVLGNVTSNY